MRKTKSAISVLKIKEIKNEINSKSKSCPLLLPCGRRPPAEPRAEPSRAEPSRAEPRAMTHLPTLGAVTSTAPFPPCVTSRLDLASRSPRESARIAATPATRGFLSADASLCFLYSGCCLEVVDARAGERVAAWTFGGGGGGGERRASEALSPGKAVSGKAKKKKSDSFVGIDMRFNFSFSMSLNFQSFLWELTCVHFPLSFNLKSFCGN